VGNGIRKKGETVTRVETLIVENIWRFDPINLITLLNYIGYSMNDISFRSHYSNCSQSHLVQDIKFYNAPKGVVITLNMGLLGGQSALPSYFFDKINTESFEGDKFTGFFGYFDDRLLRRFLFAVYSELDQTFVQSWETRKRAELYTLKLDSIVTLQWLFQLVFPELQVRVDKAPLKRSLTLQSPILGKLTLGHQTVFGKKKELSVLGKCITLITDDEYFTNNNPWTHEINMRLESLLFPILYTVGLSLEIWLVIRSQGTSLSLKQNSYLGYENIHSDNLQVKRVRIFSGFLCS